ncbi:adenylate kinase [Porphyromonas macacae]|uniref:adenylate kinase n=1 Tax=Porphyromonas macacae TaxID=28115 RepID=UPI00052DA125|nr:adenylate kinase [Porphyromonas macacae]KGO00084.1 adenylate kinase [Porphyromonas macacae]
MTNIVIFGAPGSGKGTQSENLIKRYGFKHVSTGDLLRAEIKQDTELGQVAKRYIDKGQLVPDEYIIQMIEHLLSQLQKEAGLIFDGFPRTVAQAVALDDLLVHHQTKVDVVLDLKVPQEELIDRLLKRGQISGRSDDNLETIKKRLLVYHNQTAPLASYYANKGVLKTIEGTGTVSEIGDRIVRVVDALHK